MIPFKLKENALSNDMKRIENFEFSILFLWHKNGSYSKLIGKNYKTSGILLIFSGIYDIIQ